MEKYLALGFMIFGLGFFLFTINITRNDEDSRYNRKLNEAREFGFEDSKLKKEIQKSKK